MPSNYKDSKLILIRLRELHAEGKLSKLSEKLLFSPERQPEELYLFTKILGKLAIFLMNTSTPKP